jgi:hypothetical protein
VVPGEPGSGLRAGELVAVPVDVVVLVDGELAAALVAGPAEVLAAAAQVDLLPARVADVAHEQGLARPRAGHQRGAEGIAQAERPHARGEIGWIPRVEGIVGQPQAGRGIDAQHLARQRGGVLRAEDAQVLGRGRSACSEAGRIVPTRVDDLVVSAVAVDKDERAVAHEGQRSGRVRQVHLGDAVGPGGADQVEAAGVVRQELARAVVAQRESNQSRERGQIVVDRVRVGIDHQEQIDVAVEVEGRVDRQPEHAPIAVAERLGGEREDQVLLEIVLHVPELAGLLGDQEPRLVDEGQRHRALPARADRLGDEAGGQDRTGALRREGYDEGDERRGEERAGGRHGSTQGREPAQRLASLPRAGWTKARPGARGYSSPRATPSPERTPSAPRA